MSTLDDAAYCGPIGQPIHCSFHQILSMRLSWQPAYGNRHLVELGVKQQAAQCVLAAGRSAVDADARDVVVGVFRCNRLVPENAIGETGIAEVLPGHVVKRLRAVRRAHAVDLDHDEAEFGQRLHRR